MARLAGPSAAHFGTRAISLAAVLCLAPARVRAGVFPDSPFSDDAAGTTGAVFLKNPGGAREHSLGGSAMAASYDSEALFWNPGGLARLEPDGRSELSTSFGALLESSYHGTLAYARPLADGRGVVGAGLAYLGQSSIEGFNTVGDPDGSFAPNDLALCAGYARKAGRAGLGAALKLIRSEVADVSGTSFALDLGFQIERVTDIGEGALDFGAGLRNLGPAIKLGSVSDPLPFKFQAGVLWHISPRVNALLDGHLPVDDDPYASLGLEVNYPVNEAFRGSFRAGYNARNERDIDGLTGFAAGIGARIARMRVDYAWIPLGDVGSTHRISLGFLF